MADLGARVVGVDAPPRMIEHAVKASHYILPHTYMGLAMTDQPRPHHYFHRPTGVLLNIFLAAGFVADGIEEPVFDHQPADDVLNWDSFNEIPPILVVRLRRSS